MPLAQDLLYPDPEKERQKHKLKRLVQHPNSFFMDVKCPACKELTIVFSHSQSAVQCRKCDRKLGRPTGGKLRLSADCQFRVKHG